LHTYSGVSDEIPDDVLDPEQVPAVGKTAELDGFGPVCGHRHNVVVVDIARCDADHVFLDRRVRVMQRGEGEGAFVVAREPCLAEHRRPDRGGGALEVCMADDMLGWGVLGGLG
jgi:hypothetical protein